MGLCDLNICVFEGLNQVANGNAALLIMNDEIIWRGK